ncbi:MAG TPA: sugar phosphate isomerase/epimerase [Roseimicrobium sp.]|nr:sugar phosphate isomerase/epimerase [Roseimicrobium sp.]
MSSPARDFGVQSYCFRNFKDNADVAKKVRTIGLDKIELCGIHADFNKPDAMKDVVKIYTDAGVKIVSLGVQTFVGADTERDWFECAKTAGAKHISAHFRVDSFSTAVPRTAKLAEEYGMRVGIHLHGGYMFGGSMDVIDHLLKIGGPRINLHIDTAWCMQTGPNNGNPVKWVEKFAGRISGIHYKDFIFDKNAQWHDVVVGTGNLDLPAFIKALETAKFDGMAVIEYEADPENPVPALTECVKKMRTA